jgi:nucleoside-diphosphate-sugar epimerase
MRIFLTGATGYVGSAVLDALVRAGHEVTALVRTHEGAARVMAHGGKPVVGVLQDPSSYRAAADAQDGYVHTALDAAQAETVDRQALDVILPAARRPRTSGSPVARRVVVYVSDVRVLGRASERLDEDAPLNPIPLVSWRPEHESRVLAAADAGLRTVVVRPGVVYGGGRGVVGALFRDAANGLVRVVGDGNNHWPLIYDRDLADLVVRLAAHANAEGIYHANDEGDERVNDIVDAIAPYLPMRPDVRHMPLTEARTRLGARADALALDQLIRSPRARALGWVPTLKSVAGNAARLLEEWRGATNRAA